jgi:hypothetical protein
LTVALLETNNCTIRGAAENLIFDATANARNLLLNARNILLIDARGAGRGIFRHAQNGRILFALIFPLGRRRAKKPAVLAGVIHPGTARLNKFTKQTQFNP